MKATQITQTANRRSQADRSALAGARMIDAAIELLNSVGLQGTTLVAIGERAGYSRGLATHHFGSKHGLFRAVLKHVSGAWSRDLARALEGLSGLAAIEASIDAHLAHITEHPHYLRAQYILWGVALDPASGFEPNVSEFMGIQRSSVRKWVEDGIRSGDIDPDLSATHFAEQFYGCLIGINHQWLLNTEFELEAAYVAFRQSTLERIKRDPTP